MDRGQVADALDEIGLLLDLKGENPFKSLAYQNAARVVRGLDRDLRELARSGELIRIKGIGEALSAKIAALAETGRLAYLDDLRAEIPGDLLEWLRIPGLGPKRVRAIHAVLGISALADLEYACRQNQLRDLAGFGDAMQARILEGIERLRRHAGRFLQPLVQAESETLVRIVRAAAGVVRAEVAGSVRRRAETSKDIDVVASAEQSGSVLEAFADAPGVAEVTERGETKCSVRLEAGPSANLRVVADRSYPFALAYFTGSKAHNVALRGRARRLGFKLNEYGLTRETDGAEVACASEGDLYAALGLGWVPPELREDRGEIEAAEAGALPDLIDLADLRGILHVHSNWSDGTASISEMVEAARAIGMTYLGLCDHSRSAAYAGGLSLERVREQHAEVDALNRDYGGTFRILKGIEVDILPDGSLDYPDEVLATFDLVVASVHSRFGLPADEQTARVLRALDNPFVDLLGHPTGRLLLSRDGHPLDLFRVIDAAAERGVAIEINAHPMRLDLGDEPLRYGLKRGLKTSVNPDAHDPEGLGAIRYGIGVARRAWCTPDDVLNAWSLDRLLSFLSGRRP